jgi:large subunit ribosomal protein L19e
MTNNKKRLAAEILKVSPKKIRFSSEALEDIEKAITRSDVRGLIAIGKIFLANTNEQSRVRARKNANQKRKGRRTGRGSKKGRKNAVLSGKSKWIARIRVQRAFLKELKNKNLLSTANYQMLYSKCKGGYFRNKRHIKLYLTEHRLLQNIAK